MASSIIHICIAKKANEILKRNEKELLLGSIAPDISKHVGETKEKSHFLDKNTNRAIPNLKKFLNKYQKSLKTNDFNLGYYCHLYADMMWFSLFINNYLNLKETEIKYRDGRTIKMEHKKILNLLYNDYTNLNTKLINYYNLNLSLFKTELPLIDTKINEIPINKLYVIINDIDNFIKESKDRPNIIFGPKTVERFIDKTTESFLRNLEEIGVI